MLKPHLGIVPHLALATDIIFFEARPHSAEADADYDECLEQADGWWSDNFGWFHELIPSTRYDKLTEWWENLKETISQRFTGSDLIQYCHGQTLQIDGKAYSIPPEEMDVCGCRVNLEHHVRHHPFIRSRIAVGEIIGDL